MLSEQFNLYYKDTIALVRSMVFKMDIQNELLNKRLRDLGRDVLADPKTWKYNMNLAGLYHDVDVPMNVVSSDTQVEIQFDRTTLASHPRTVLRHIRGQLEYQQLVARYPRQETLINGIIKPIDLDKIVEAEDWTLLHYDSAYVAANETSLISRIQEWVRMFVTRWWNPDFSVSDPLYPASFYGKLLSFLIPAIMNIRLELATTNEAAPFHVWSYLSGHYELDNYKSFLTLDQSLWLYRNIVHLRKQAGTTNNLNALLENITRPAGLTISRLDFIQQDSTLLTTGKRTSSYSLTDYVKEEPSLASGDLLTARQVHLEIEDRAPNNSKALDTDVAEAVRKGNSLKYNLLPTKVLKANEDGALISQTISNLPLKINYWIYMSYLDLFQSDFTIPIPDAGAIFLDTKEAFILFMYAANRSYGNTLTHIPDLKVKSVIPVVYPTSAEIRPLAPIDCIKDEDIGRLLSDLTSLRATGTRSEFVRFIEDIQNQLTRIEIEEQLQPHPDYRSYMRDLAQSLNTDVDVALTAPDTRYDEWLFDKGIDALSLSDRDWLDLAVSILSIVVDHSDESTSVGARQRAMIEILDSLTSYDIMVLQGDGSARSREINIPTVMFFDPVFTQDVEALILSGECVTDQSADKVKSTICGDIAYGLTLEIPTNLPYVFDIEAGESIVTNQDTSIVFYADAASPQFDLLKLTNIP